MLIRFVDPTANSALLQKVSLVRLRGVVVFRHVEILRNGEACPRFVLSRRSGLYLQGNSEARKIITGGLWGGQEARSLEGLFYRGGRTTVLAVNNHQGGLSTSYVGP